MDKLKLTMDANFVVAKDDIQAAARAMDTDGFWTIWCKCAEEAYIQTLGLTRKMLRRRDAAPLNLSKESQPYDVMRMSGFATNGHLNHEDA